MPFVPVSLVVHVALTSVLSVGWAIVALRVFSIGQAAARRWILATAVLLPVAGFLAHLIYPRDCISTSGLYTHFSCLISSSLGGVGTGLFAASVGLATLQALATFAVQARIIRQSAPFGQFELALEVGDKVRRAVREIEGRMSILLRVAVTAKPGVCCTVGVMDPTIVISEELCESLDYAELKAALAHEAAHIVRSDTFVGLASALVKALTFFSPAVYLGIRLYMDDREKAADDLAVDATSDPLALAAAVVKVAQAGRPALVAANVTGAGRIKGRVQRLLDGEQTASRGTVPLAIASVVAAIGLALITFYTC